MQAKDESFMDLKSYETHRNKKSSLSFTKCTNSFSARIHGQTLGAAGNPIVKTPVLDALAKEGVRFTQNCVTTSICWISRATLYR